MGTTTGNLISMIEQGERVALGLPLTGEHASAYAGNHTTDKKHRDVDCASAKSATNDQNDTSELNGPFPAESIRRPSTQRASQDCSSAIDTIESADNIGRVCISRRPLRC